MALILAIDDDPDILRVLNFTLREVGHDVLCSADPGNALALALMHRPDAAVLDIEMPEVSGFDLLHALRDEPRTNGLPILFLSGRNGSNDRVRGLREGADDYLVKPFDPEELTLRVALLLGRRPQEKAASDFAANLRQSLRERRVVGDIRLGRYQVQEIVGEGGFGLVFRGWDPQLRRPVALKVLTGNRVTKYGDIAQFLREAVTAAHLSDPSIVTVHDVGDDSVAPFIAMEYIDGPSLSHHLQDDGRLAADQVVFVGLGVARALAVAHGRGVLHRDVKPANVLLGRDGSIKLTDFSIADFVVALAGEEGVFGTPGFIAPEVIKFQRYSEQGDLFALGATLYKAVTGVLPYGTGNYLQRICRTTRGKPEPLRDHAPETPEALEGLIHELLAKHPEERPCDAADVTARLEAMRDPATSWKPPLHDADHASFRLSGSRSTFIPKDKLTNV
jgi:serine/threonine-protein kinase